MRLYQWMSSSFINFSNYLSILFPFSLSLSFRLFHPSVFISTILPRNLRLEYILLLQLDLHHHSTSDFGKRMDDHRMNSTFRKDILKIFPLENHLLNQHFNFGSPNFVLYITQVCIRTDLLIISSSSSFPLIITHQRMPQCLEAFPFCLDCTQRMMIIYVCMFSRINNVYNNGNKSSSC